MVIFFVLAWAHVVFQWPEVRPAPPPPLAAEAFVTTRAESTSHVSAWITLPAPNKAIGLAAQTPKIQLVCHGTMDEIKISLFFTEFFPVLTVGAGFMRPIMTTVAERDPKTVSIYNIYLYSC